MNLNFMNVKLKMAEETKRASCNITSFGLENKLFQNEKNIPISPESEDDLQQDFSLTESTPSTSACASSDLSPVENDKTLDPSNITEIFGSLFPHLSRDEIEVKLRNNSDDSSYKAKLLQECITSAFEEGFEVQEEVFHTLDQWLNDFETVHNVTSLTTHGHTNFDIKLGEERSESPFIARNAVGIISTVQTDNEDEFLKGISTLYCSSEQLSEIDSVAESSEIDEDCEENMKTIPQNLSLTSSSSEESRDIPEEELKSSLVDNAPQNLQVLFNDMPEETKSWCLRKVDFLSEVHSTLNKQYIFSQVIYCLNDADVNIVSERLFEEGAALPERNPPHNLDTQELGAVKEDLSLVESLEEISCEEQSSISSADGPNTGYEDAISIASSSTSSLLSVEESVEPLNNETCNDPNSPNKKEINLDSLEKQPSISNEDCSNYIGCEDSISIASTSSVLSVEESVEPLNNKTRNDNNSLNKKEMNLDSLEEGPVTPVVEAVDTEAEAICHLIPFLKLESVRQKLIDNYDHPQRKGKVLSEYIELSLDEGHEINNDVFETLSQWQASIKRSCNDQPENGTHKRQKPCDENPLQENTNILVDESLLQKSSLVDNAPPNLQVLFNDMPEETKSWCLKKVGFLSEVHSALNRQYIFSQVIHCRNDADINIVSERLFGEAATLAERNPQELGAAGEDLPLVGASEDMSTESGDCSEMNALLPVNTIDDKTQDHIHQLAEMFLDADPDFLSEKAIELAGDDDKFAALVTQLLETRLYPKMEEYYERQKKEDLQKKFSQCKSAEEIVECFGNTEKPEASMVERIKELHSQREEERETLFQIAKENGELQVCQCCFDDEVLIADMSTCRNTDNLHFFCNPCIKRYCEEQIGQGREEFRCIEGECSSPFSVFTLQSVLPSSVFANLFKEKQAEEIAAAGLEDLESCPFCHFATIMPNKEDKVFKCLNAKCLVDSCRLCKEVNHIPLRCVEVENKRQTNARTFIENEMTEAMVRECYKCRKRFIKEEGCNKMICACGAMMCYLCKVAISGYDHFENRRPGTCGTKCPMYTDSRALHAEEVRSRAAEAKQMLEPGLRLVHDPAKDFLV